MSNYKYNNTDFDSLCEPNAATGISTCNACPFLSSYYGNMGGYASYDASYGYMALAFPTGKYAQANSNVPVSALGYRPRNTFRFEFTSSDIVNYITRSDSEITTWNLSGTAIGHYSASLFGLSKAPYILIFYLAGGGGGGGGGSGTVSAGGGGGGGVILGYVRIPTTSNYIQGVSVRVGVSGPGGAGGTGSNAKAGIAGGPSFIYYGDYYVAAGGGNGGVGGAKGAGAGTGGTTNITNVLSGSLGVFANVTGGNGGASGGYAGANCTISGIVAPDFTYSNTGVGGAGPTSQGGGGGSYGIGGRGVASGSGWDGEQGGGGGGGVYTIFDGKNGGDGGAGIARFYY